MVKLNIVNYSEGLAVESSSVTPSEVGLADYEEFCNPIELVLNINKIGSEIYVRAAVSTTAKLLCDRCLDEYEWLLKEKIDIVLTSDASLTKNDQDDVYFLTNATKEIDITESIRQLLIISMPEKKLCKKNCKGMCSQCGTNLNLETCGCTNEKTDPRWEALKKLKFK